MTLCTHTRWRVPTACRTHGDIAIDPNHGRKASPRYVARHFSVGAPPGPRPAQFDRSRFGVVRRFHRDRAVVPSGIPCKGRTRFIGTGQSPQASALVRAARGSIRIGKSPQASAWGKRRPNTPSERGFSPARPRPRVVPAVSTARTALVPRSPELVSLVTSLGPLDPRFLDTRFLMEPVNEYFGKPGANV